MRRQARSRRDDPTEGIGRREFLKLTGAAALGAVLPTALARRASSATDPRVVIVGGGLAGLTTAYELRRRRGWSASVYEASDHLGGRTRTIRGLAGGQYAEAGGGGISSNEGAIKRLARHLGLRLRDTWEDYPDGSETYYFGGRRYTWAQLRPGLDEIADAAYDAWRAIGGRIPSAADHNAAAADYDNMSVAEFLSAHTDFGPSTPAGSFTVHDHAIEYGGRAEVSSSIELILEQGDFWGPGPYDERWAVRGGNDRLASALASRLSPDAINLGHRLVAVVRLADGTYRATFDRAGSSVEVAADHLVLAVPAVALRSDRVDLGRAGISDLHMGALDRMTMGTNAKLNLQFAGTPWSRSGSSGDATTDTLVESTWQQSFFSSKPAILVAMNNQTYPGAPAHGTLPDAQLPATLAAVDTIYPGASQRFVGGQAYLDAWTNDELIGGSYASSPLGSFTRYGGVEARREGNIHFAGEHTARYERTGTMDGAVESAIRVAAEIGSA